MLFRRPWFFLQFCLFITLATASAVSARAQAPQTSAAQARINTAIDESSLVTLRGSVHPLAQVSFDNGPAPVSMPASRMLLVLSRSMQQEANLQTYLQSVQDESSPNYHKFLSPSEFGKRFGVSDTDMQTVQAWLTGHGFTVNQVHSGRTAIEFSGTAGQVQSTFHTSLHSYTINHQKFWASAADPQIPSALSPVVAGIATLNSLTPKAQNIRGPSGKYDAQSHTITPTYTFGNATNGYYIFLGPADVATIYNTPTTLNPHRSGTAYDGTGVTIGIAGDSNIDLTQNANYRATFGLPAKAATVVVDGADPGENGDAIEAYLDIQVAGGIAPNANVILYTAADTSYQAGLFLAVARAIDDNQADILNVSFGNCEAALGTAGNQFINSLWEQAAAQGITVTVSSGDSGSAGCDDPNTETVAVNGLAVNGIGSTPYNIAVGGTDYDTLDSNFPASFSTYVDLTNTLPNHRSALQYIPEEPWNDSTLPNTSILQNVPISVASHYASPDNIIAGGGGLSTVYAAPGWQSGFGGSGGRNLPDVSLLAGNGFYGALWGICTDQDYDPKTGTVLKDCAGTPATGNSFNLTGVGGTSAAAPAFAGMLALVEQKVGSRLGQADYVLYQLAKTYYSTVFHDVITGDNSVLCKSGTPDCQPVTIVNTNYISGCNAATGYDQASGLGSVDAARMTLNWASAIFGATFSSLQLNGATTALNITHGQSVAVSAAVTSAGGTPSGSIALVDNLSPASSTNAVGIASYALSSGKASGTTTSLPGGSYQISAHYGGDSTFAESDSNAIPVTVAAESSTTTLKVAGFYDPSTGKAATTPYYGFIYLIDAQPYGNSASAASPNGAATGTMTFKSGSATLGTSTLSSQGVAELQTATLPGGYNSLTAVFPGDASFQASTSAPLAFSVTPAVTTLSTPSAQPSFVIVGNSLTLSVTLSANSAGAAPTGTVTFMNGSTKIGSASLAGTAANATAPAGGTASLSTTGLPAGTNTVTAIYGGDGNYGGTTSPVAMISVSKVNTVLTLSPASPTIKVNQPLQFTVTPTPVTGLPSPTGSVSLYLGGTSSLLTPANLVNGAATFTIPANTLPLGTAFIDASYSGDNDYSSGMATLQVTVNSSGTITPTLTLVPPAGTVNFPFSTKVNVSGPSGDPVPTGTVTLSSPGFSYPQTMPLTNGSATLTVSCCMAGGQNTLTATYLGDNNYTGGTKSGVVNLFSNTNVTFPAFPPNIAVNQPLSVAVAVVGNYTNLTIPPTGTVTLSSGSYTSSPAPLVAGSTTITVPANSLAIGDDTLNVTYSGDANYLPSSNFEPVGVTAAVPPGFAITGSAVTVAAGTTSGNTSTITLTPSGGFTGSVALTASIASGPAGALYPPVLSFGSTSPVSITGASAAAATLTITTTAATSAALLHPKLTGDRWYTAGGAALACILLFGVPARRRRWRNMFGLLALFLILAGGVLACGGGGGSGGGTGNPGTTAGAYTITVTGTSGAISASGTVTLTVQ